MKIQDPGGTRSAFHYRWNGLLVRSSMRLPGLRDLEACPGGGVDVTLSIREPGTELPTAEPLPLRERFVLSVPGVARYVVQGARRIVVQPFTGSDPRRIGQYLMGSAMGVLCHQRGLLPLHASSVRVGTGCVAFVGPSGAGKSTLAAFLARAGYPLVCDDVTVVAPGCGGSGPRVAPGAGVLRLCGDGVRQLGRDTGGLQRIVGRRERYLLESSVEPQPLPLARIYCLTDSAAPCLEQLSPAAGVRWLTNHVYRRKLAGQMALERQLQDAVGSIAAGVEIYRFSRVRGFENMADHVALLSHHWKCSLGEPLAGMATA